MNRHSITGVLTLPSRNRHHPTESDGTRRAHRRRPRSPFACRKPPPSGLNRTKPTLALTFRVPHSEFRTGMRRLFEQKNISNKRYQARLIEIKRDEARFALGTRQPFPSPSPHDEEVGSRAGGEVLPSPCSHRRRPPMEEVKTAPGDLVFCFWFFTKSFFSGPFSFLEGLAAWADDSGMSPLWGERQHGCASTSYWYACLQARLHSDCSLAQSSRGMSGSNSSTEPVQGRSTNARHSQNSTCFAGPSLVWFDCFAHRL